MKNSRNRKSKVELAKKYLKAEDLMKCFETLISIKDLITFLSQQTENLRQQIFRNEIQYNLESENNWSTSSRKALASHIDLIERDILNNWGKRKDFKIESILTLRITDEQNYHDFLAELTRLELVKVPKTVEVMKQEPSLVLLRLTMAPSMTYRLKYIYTKKVYPRLLNYEAQGDSWEDYLRKVIHLDFIDIHTSSRKLAGMNLSNRYLVHNLFNSKDLSNAILDGGFFNGSIFEDSNLKGASLKNANLKNARLDRVSLEGAELSQCYLSGVNLKDAVLKKATLKRAYLPSANLTNAILDQVNAEKVNMRNTQLERASLINIYLESADLRFANFFYANCRDAILDFALLDHMQASYANFEGSSLFKAHLQEVNFSRANLSRVNFTRSNLVKVNFEGANLTKCTFLGARMDDITWLNSQLDGAIFPATYKSELKSSGINISNVIFQ